MLMLRKRDKMQGLPSIISLFHKEFNKFNNIGARMLDSIYHIAFNLLKNLFFGVNTSRFLPPIAQHYNGRHYVTLQNL